MCRRFTLRYYRDETVVQRALLMESVIGSIDDGMSTTGNTTTTTTNRRTCSKTQIQIFHFLNLISTIWLQKCLYRCA